jgi:hypothetical protein
MILVTSIIFLLPFGLIIYNVKNQYCLGKNPKIDNPFSKDYQDYKITKNTFKNFVTIQSKGYDYCPIQAKVFDIYNHEGEPSFCKERIPNFYGWIQIRYWNVIFLSFVQLGAYELLLFVFMSVPIIFFYIWFATKNLFWKFFQGMSTPIDYLSYAKIDSNDSIDEE